MPQLELQIAENIAGDIDSMPDAADFRRWAAAALAGRREDAELSIRVVDEPEGRQLNRDYRGKDYATNVLSFPAGLPADIGVPLLGDLALCAPVIAREAREQRKPARAHWAHLTVHGCLHLLGFDHGTEKEAVIMETLETEILARLGYPDPYEEN